MLSTAADGGTLLSMLEATETIQRKEKIGKEKSRKQISTVVTKIIYNFFIEQLAIQ